MKFFYLTILILFFNINIGENLKCDSSDFNKKLNSSNSNTDIEDEWVEEQLSKMTLREKIAQMIISYSDGYSVDQNSVEYKRLVNLVANEKIGGFIFFKGNSIQEAELINKLQSLSDVPLLISADFERGTKMRLEDGSLFPNNMAIGATWNPELAYLMGLQISKECRALGIHQNYAPVVDVNNNPNNPIINVRSFGEDPNLVSLMSEKMIKGLQDGNVIATAKHFPGHGDTDIDSHSDLPVLNFDMNRLNSLELIPFKNAIKNDVKSIMIAHLSFPELEKEKYVPASLSPAIVQNLLIDQLNYKGLIVTDALNMAGVTKHFSNEEVALRCVKAGIDLILMPLKEKLAITTIENAVLNGIISEERINHSARKILQAKKWLKLNENKIVDMSKISEVVNSTEAQNLSQRIADESITLVKNINSLVPFKQDNSQSCLIVSLNNGKEKANSNYFFSRFNELNNFSKISQYDVVGEVTNGQEIINASSQYDVVIIPIYAKVKINTGTVGIPNSQVNLINKLVQNGKKVLVISFGNPYLIQGFKDVDSYICAYGDSETSINASLKSIFGLINFKGKLPVTLTDEYKFGHGLETK